MRIAFLNPLGKLGGAERSLLDIFSVLRQAKPEWVLHLIAGSDGSFLGKARELGVSVEHLPLPERLARLGDAGLGGREQHQSRLLMLPGLAAAGFESMLYASRLRRALSVFRPNIVHSNGFKMDLLGKWAKPRGVPLIWHIRDYPGLRPFMAGLLRRHAGGDVIALANSRSVAEDVVRVCGEGFKVTPIYNAVDLERFSPSGPGLDLDEASGLPPAPAGTVRAGLVATFANWKGHETFLEALSRLPSDLDWRAYVIGGAIYQTLGSQYDLADLRDKAARLGLADRVGFTGFVEDTARVMRSLDIVVHASTRPEPFGLVIPEAMACGRALIVSLSGGVPELVSVGTDALAHQPGDAATLSDCILRLARDRELRVRMGQAGRVKAVERFDRARMARELIPVYESLVGAEA